MKTYLDQYYQPDTQLFYGYPAGNDKSGFFNTVPKWIERLVSLRPIVSCIDPQGSMEIVTLEIRDELQKILEEIGTPYMASRDRLINLNPSQNLISDEQWNEEVKSKLLANIAKGRLVMAQALQDSELESLYQIPSAINLGLNDKLNLADLFPENCPEIIRSYKSGLEFYESNDSTPFPCVVKASQSSSGDAVFICKTPQDLLEAKNKFKDLRSNIFVEEYLEFEENLCVQFGVKPNGEMDFLIPNQQLTIDGEFLGGIVDPNKSIPNDVQEYFKTEMLQRLASKNWFGIAGVDVLVGRSGWKAIDPNFRPNASSWASLWSLNRLLGDKKMAVFTGRMENTRAIDRLKDIAEFGSPNQLLALASLTVECGDLGVNGAVVFDQMETLKENAKLLLDKGIRSSALNKLSQ